MAVNYEFKKLKVSSISTVFFIFLVKLISRNSRKRGRQKHYIIVPKSELKLPIAQQMSYSRISCHSLNSVKIITSLGLQGFLGYYH
ncbi:MAG: hypothetical protein K0R18_840 [Bacillales bacterium]|nr:hypothetical protein [Bacillales bacterium]